MNQTLQDFIAEHCHLNDRGSTRFCDFRKRFLATLPEAERANWTRPRMIVELSKAFDLGMDGSKTLRIVGISFEPATALVVIDGRVTHTA